MIRRSVVGFQSNLAIHGPLEDTLMPSEPKSDSTISKSSKNTPLSLDKKIEMEDKTTLSLDEKIEMKVKEILRDQLNKPKQSNQLVVKPVGDTVIST